MKVDKTMYVNYPNLSDRDIDSIEYKFKYGIRRLSDCQNASEEYICGFVKDNDAQLDLFLYNEEYTE